MKTGWKLCGLCAMESTESVTDQKIMCWAYLSSKNTALGEDFQEAYKNPQFLKQECARCRAIQCKTGLMAQFLGELK